jgi:hypothetical protein
MKDGFIRISETGKDVSIYRFMRVEHFLDLFLNKSSWLAAPRQWDDPWENFLAKAEFRGYASFPDECTIFGQCWTSVSESDATWRIYTPQKNGVRIETTPRDLMNSIEDSNTFRKDTYDKRMKMWFSAQANQCFIGRVLYVPTPSRKCSWGGGMNMWLAA